MKYRSDYIIKKIRELGSRVLPPKASLLLYGSRARGDYHDDSDWDMLIILDKDRATHEDFNSYAFPFCMLGAEMQEIFSLLIYGKQQWQNMHASSFSQNVLVDKIELL